MIKILNIDQYLILAFLIGLVFCLYGIDWGRVETWNHDQPFYHKLGKDGNSIKPRTQKKPPFYTYLGQVTLSQ